MKDQKTQDYYEQLEDKKGKLGSIVGTFAYSVGAESIKYAFSHFGLALVILLIPVLLWSYYHCGLDATVLFNSIVTFLTSYGLELIKKIFPIPFILAALVYGTASCQYTIVANEIDAIKKENGSIKVSEDERNEIAELVKSTKRDDQVSKALRCKFSGGTPEMRFIRRRTVLVYINIFENNEQNFIVELYIINYSEKEKLIFVESDCQWDCGTSIPGNKTLQKYVVPTGANGVPFVVKISVYPILQTKRSGRNSVIFEITINKYLTLKKKYLINEHKLDENYNPDGLIANPVKRIRIK